MRRRNGGGIDEKWRYRGEIEVYRRNGGIEEKWMYTGEKDVQRRNGGIEVGTSTFHYK